MIEDEETKVFIPTVFFFLPLCLVQKSLGSLKNDCRIAENSAADLYLWFQMCYFYGGRSTDPLVQSIHAQI